MTSLKQLAANRYNALKSTGPRTEDGKLRSRQNAMRHGLTAETVIAAIENAADYRALEHALLAEYRPRSVTERELVLRLASVLWRLRRSTGIETGLFQIQGEILQRQRTRSAPRRPSPSPADQTGSPPLDIDVDDAEPTIDTDRWRTLSVCFLRVTNLENGSFELLSRYETALWRQVAQIIFILQSTPRR